MELVVPSESQQNTSVAFSSSPKTLDHFLADYSCIASDVAYRDLTVETLGNGSVSRNGHRVYH